MRRKTWIEGVCVLLLAAVAVAIGWNRFNRERGREGNGPQPTPTPRMRSLLRTLDAGAPPPTPTPEGDRTVSEEPPLLDPAPETGFLVVEVREADGTLPAGDVRLVNRELGFEREMEEGRLTLETVAGPATFSVEADERATGPLTTMVSADRPAQLVFTLPEPEPVLGTTGLRLAPAEEFYQVVEVDPESSADAAGLRPGDVVIAIENVAIDTLTAEQIAAALLGVPGERVRLQVVIRNERGEFEEHRIELVLLP